MDLLLHLGRSGRQLVITVAPVRPVSGTWRMSAAEPSLYVTSVPRSDTRSPKPGRSGGLVSRMTGNRAAPPPIGWTGPPSPRLFTRP
ncbi:MULTISPECIES: hypothetical protein [unclassified Streptomyces]|uniref:hypothetical protein n=1 Tax=unclassified Streptomyces TaxID=2593676 RepID=UPI002DD89F18|nr:MULTISPECIES: hypothetical protein [unclassified Streptomyces]WSC47564.1 hypothetical protein OIE61_28405 [Streptomyces sp. NBC_01762]WSC53445.1 hypothetical protein OG808_14935 [Streptomyces sp. NBC_01761]WSD27217.1 hypothetical protein OHA26_29115 [Streptomyces sp. NBC_01751]WSF84288.1 hypothetical protein OIE70_15035 [Streptomyces sp. NBC_01744]